MRSVSLYSILQYITGMESFPFQLNGLHPMPYQSFFG